MRQTSRILTLQNISTNFTANKNVSRNRRQNQTICVTRTTRPHNDRRANRVNYNATTGPRRNVKSNRAFITGTFPGTINRNGNLTKFNVQGRSIKGLVTTLARRDTNAVKISLRQLDISGHSFNKFKSRRVNRVIRNAFTGSRVVQLGYHSNGVRYSLECRVGRFLHYTLEHGPPNVSVGINSLSRC